MKVNQLVFGSFLSRSIVYNKQKMLSRTIFSHLLFTSSEKYGMLIVEDAAGTVRGASPPHTREGFCALRRAQGGILYEDHIRFQTDHRI